jgi:hypothetical protein
MNTFLSPQWMTTDTAVNYKNSIKLIRNFDRQWNDEWNSRPGFRGIKVGYTVQVRLPQRWQVTEGQALVQQAILNQTVPLTLNHQFQVGMGWSSADHALLVEEAQKVTSKAGIALANKADVIAGLEVYKAVYFVAGPVSSQPLSNIAVDGVFTDAVAKLRNVGVPEDLCCVVDPKMQSLLLKVAFNQFNPQNQVTKFWNKGQFSGPALGVDEWYWDPNIPTHASGNFTTSTWLVDGALQTGSTLVVKGGGTYSLNAGDTFQIAGVNAANPQSYIDVGDVQTFSLVAPVAGAGAGTWTISPSIIPLVNPSGQVSPLATVSASPANNALITFTQATGGVNATMAAQTSRQSLIFHKEAFAFVMADLPVPLAGANSARKSDADAKLSMRWVEQYNIQTDQEPSKMECLVGVAPILPYFALRIFY